LRHGREEMDGIQEVLRIQWKCLFEEFTHPGIPWEGIQCRSWRAGGTGCLMALPAFFAPSPDREFWILQGFLSVWADYFEIHHRSIVHGLDRSFATCMLIRVLVLCAMTLRPLPVLVAAVVPLACYSRSASSKVLRNINGWKCWHGWWHVTGSLLVSGAWSAMVKCSTTDASVDLLNSRWSEYCR